MSISSLHTTDTWWLRLRVRLLLGYILLTVALILISGAGHLRLLSDVGRTFGGFFWAIDTNGQVVVVSTPPQLSPFSAYTSSITSSDTIIAVNGQEAASNIGRIYQHARPGDIITYRIQHNTTIVTVKRLAVTFTMDMWWSNYGLAFLAGLIWLLVGMVLLATAQEWTGAVEGITLVPPAMLFLLYSHWGNAQQVYPADVVFQLLWVPSFALLGAAFIHLSLTYRPQALRVVRRPAIVTDALPYLPLLALGAYEWSSYLIFAAVPTRPNLVLSLGYGVVGGIISFGIGITSLLRVAGFIPGIQIPSTIRRRLGDLLTLWIGGIGLGFCLGILPILLTGQPLLPLPMFYLLAMVYPFLLLYAIRSLRLIDRLQVTLEQREAALLERETALLEQQKTAEALRQTNQELQQATSLLLHADAHLRSILSQRIHDQPKQQALRIRSLLGHWQHKLKREAEQTRDGKVASFPVVEALGKVRKISEELESDLRGLQLLVEDVYQRRSLGLKLHLEKLILEDLPMLHPESSLKVQADLRSLDALDPDLEQTEEGAKIAEAISYTVTQALLNIYNHAGANHVTIRTLRTNGTLEVTITDDGKGFDTKAIPPEKTSMFKARLKAREAGGTLTIQSNSRPQADHGTKVILRIPFPRTARKFYSGPLRD